MICSIVLAAVLAQAPVAPAAPVAPHKLRWTPAADIPITGVLVTGWLVSEAFKKDLAPSQCRWCKVNGFDNSIRVAFNPSLEPSAKGFHAADLASTLVGFIGVPLAMLGMDAIFAAQGGVFSDFWVDFLLIAEATFSALNVNQLVKFTVGRARPYTIDAPPELIAQGTDIPDNNLSFFSGHTTFTFALVSSAATIAGLRGYRNAWLMWVVGMPMATATAILRLAADKHWATDVLVGAAFGSAVGILMPTFLHGRVGPVTARVTPLSNGLALSGQF